jgi:citrate lyase beta subunit
MRPTQSVCVRINDESTSSHNDDLAAVAGLPWVKSVILPKVSSAGQVQRVREKLDPRIEILALIETARGIREVDEIANSGAARLLFGTADYASELGTVPNPDLFQYPRARLVVASSAAGLNAPVDGPTLRVDDDENLRIDAELSRSLGMGGKLCIHPRQVPVVRSVFAVEAGEIDWARSVLAGYEASGGSVFVFEGQMIDAPVVARARRLIER